MLFEQTKTQFLHVLQTGCVLDVADRVVVGLFRFLYGVVFVTGDALAMISQGSDQPFAIACHSGVGTRRLKTRNRLVMGRQELNHHS